MTDPGPPPEEALDATLRALRAPVPPQTKRTADSAGLDVAFYHAEPRLPPKAHEPDRAPRAATTEPMGGEVVAKGAEAVERVAFPAAKRQTARSLTTVPGAAHASTRLSVGIAIFGLVVGLLGLASWAMSAWGDASEAPRRPLASPSSTGGGGVGIASASSTGGAIASAGAIASTASVASAGTVSEGSGAGDNAGAMQPGEAASSHAGVTPSSVAPGTGVANRTASSSSRTSAPSTSRPAIQSRPSASAYSNTNAPASAAPAPTTKYNRFLEEDKK